MDRERLTEAEGPHSPDQVAQPTPPAAWGWAKSPLCDGRIGVGVALHLQQTAGNNALVRALQAERRSLARFDRGTPESGSQAPTTDAGAPTDGDARTDGGAESPQLRERIDRIERECRSMVADARRSGHNVAADNLERYLDGTGGVKNESVSWLRGFSAITNAERTNEERFEPQLNDQANHMRHGDRRTFTDHWDRMLIAGVTTELYYASGTSTIRSTGTFSLEMIENEVSIHGTVTHHWFDPYDWHPGASTLIPGHGTVSDADVLLLQNHRGARKFDMEADWTRTLDGHISVGHIWNTKSFLWSGP